MKNLTLIIPAKNEKESLPIVLKELKNKNYKLETLPEGSVVGTSSLRRLAQLRYHYPHLV